MSDVNPELTDESIPRLRDRVHALFGSRSDSLVKSVARFLNNNPGSLDHQNLRIIAAATPYVGDPALVAKLIDDLPVTRMHVAAKPFDIESDRANFATVLPKYSHKTRQRLVADLVQQNMIETISFCPPETVTEEGRQLLEGHLLALAEGSQDQQQKAVASRFATSRVVDAVLDDIQRRIERSERGTAGREPGPLPINFVLGSLSSVVDRNATATTPAHVTRAWSLATRCQAPSYEMSVLLSRMVKSSKLEETTAHSVIDTFESLSSLAARTETFYKELISVPEMPASVVRRAVAAAPRGSFELETYWDEHEIVDARWHFFRSETYARGLDGITETPTSEELDRWISRRPIKRLRSIDRSAIAKMTDPEALRELGKRFFDNYTLFEYVCGNPHTPKEMFTDLLTVAAERASSLSPEVHSNLERTNEHRVLSDHRLDDDHIAAFLGKKGLSSFTDSDDFVRRTMIAAENPSSGRKVFEFLRDNQAHYLVFETLANESPDPEVHRLLVDLLDEATGSRSEQLSMISYHAEAVRTILARNGTVSSEIAGALREHVDLNAHSASNNRGERTYGPREVAARLIEEGREGAPGIEPIIRALDHEWNLRNEAVEALQSLIDAGLLGEDGWKPLTGHTDRHIAMTFATHPKCATRSSALETAAEMLLKTTARAVETGAVLPEREPRNWSDLPDENDKPFTLRPAAMMIDNQVVDGLTLEVPPTPRALDKLAEEMGNCLRFYKQAVADGTEMVASARDDETSEIYAVAWRTNPHSPEPHATITQINSKHNGNRVPEAFETGVHQLTERMNRGELQPVASETPAVEQASTDREAAGDPRTVRRPVPRRGQPLALAVDTPPPPDDQRQLRGEEPFLLAQAPEDATLLSVDVERNDTPGAAVPGIDMF